MKKEKTNIQDRRQFKMLNCRECGKQDEVNGKCESLLCEDCTMEMLGYTIVNNMKKYNYEKEEIAFNNSSFRKGGRKNEE